MLIGHYHKAVVKNVHFQTLGFLGGQFRWFLSVVNIVIYLIINNVIVDCGPVNQGSDV